MVVYHAVQVVVADPAVQILRPSVAGDAVTRDAEAGEPLHVHVQERARPRPLVAAVALRLPAWPSREPMPPEHLPDRRAGPAHDPRQPPRPEVRLTSRAQDRAPPRPPSSGA